jgi:cytochrome c556
MKKTSFWVSVSMLTALSSLSIPLLANAQDVAKSSRQAGNAVTFRQSIFQLIRSNIGPLGAMAKGQMPYDVETMETNAERMMQLAAMLPDYMELDTSNFELKTSASEKIWANLDDFNEKANDLYLAAKALKSVAQTKDESQYRAAIGKVGGTCKACHDSYKTE